MLDFDDKRYDAALANFERVLELEPNHVEALYYSGVVHIALCQPSPERLGRQANGRPSFSC